MQVLSSWIIQTMSSWNHRCFVSMIQRSGLSGLNRQFPTRFLVNSLTQIYKLLIFNFNLIKNQSFDSSFNALSDIFWFHFDVSKSLTPKLQLKTLMSCSSGESSPVRSTLCITGVEHIQMGLWPRQWRQVSIENAQNWLTSPLELECYPPQQHACFETFLAISQFCAWGQRWSSWQWKFNLKDRREFNDKSRNLVQLGVLTWKSIGRFQ